MKTTSILLGRGIELSIHCPEYNTYYLSKNFLSIFWVIIIFVGLTAYKKRSMTLLILFIFSHSICMIFKALLELYLLYQPGPCNSVLNDIVDSWRQEDIFVDPFDGYMFEWNFSCWNTLITLLLGVASLFFSLFIRKKSFGYTELEQPNSYTIN